MENWLKKKCKRSSYFNLSTKGEINKEDVKLNKEITKKLEQRRKKFLVVLFVPPLSGVNQKRSTKHLVNCSKKNQKSLIAISNYISNNFK